jgi:hypothetical protein
MYYGMQFAQQFAGFMVAPCAVKTDVNMTAYRGMKGEKVKLAVVNKSAQAVSLDLPESFRSENLAERWVLRGPSLDAKEAVRFEKEESAGRTRANEIAAYSAAIFVG